MSEHSGPEDGDWLDEWFREQRIPPETAHQRFIDLFHERLEQFRLTDSNDRCYVLPFMYVHVDEVELEPKAALWIPDQQTQELVRKVGSYVHWRLDEDLRDDIEVKGIETFSGPPFFRGIVMHSQETPLVWLPHYPFGLHSREGSEQAEADFGIKFTNRLPYRNEQP